MPKRANILMIYTGGTIGMKKTPKGYMPESGYLQSLMANQRELNGEHLPKYTVIELKPLLDSSNMAPSDWVKIAQTVHDNYADYDGFLVIHGTDTMAYSSSAASFLLEQLDKPVIFTGSQIPMQEFRNDGVENLLATLLYLQQYCFYLSGVFLCFAGKLMRGNRVTKVSAKTYEGFASPNLSPVGEAGIGCDLGLEWSLVSRVENHSDELPDIIARPVQVGVFKLYPGMTPAFVRAVLAAPMQGMVLECYGAGNGPDGNAEIMAEIKAAADRGVVLVAVTQPQIGNINLDLYAAGVALRDVGVVSGFDMTTEAALTKLYYLLSKYDDIETVKHQITVSLAGELTR
ncbi:L-asparaginase [Sinobacterium caligoides]|uniref:asparaginase n=1 Tax=Sinobacterium caligoides TaxID=933926 RepID=A0A3N2DQ64_9GAMM|nr:type I asparaginase [Sinobacterium caligoides]ROS01930.1 L-asparaginase [Sinobacterium caligoides]